MSERVPAWAESDERYPEREAEWRAAIARAERAEGLLAALWTAATAACDSLGTGVGSDAIAKTAQLGRVLADTAAAAEAYRASVEAPLRAAIERWTGRAQRAEARCAALGVDPDSAVTMATAYERVEAERDEARSLPALRTCGDCGFSTLRHCRHPAEVEEYRGTSSIDPDAAPPSWCPLRGRRR